MAVSPRHYAEIKADILRHYLRFAFERGARMGWPVDQVVGSVDYECETAYCDPLSKTMAAAVILALTWSEPQVFNGQARSRLIELLESSEVRAALIGCPQAERDEFLHDLEALGIAPSWLASTSADS